MQPEERRELVSNRRAQILQAALSLIARQGFAATSMEDVARAAGIGKGTIYLYFSTKEALLEALFDAQSLFSEIGPLIAHLRPDTTLDAMVRSIVPQIWEVLGRRREGLILLLREGTDHGAKFIERTLPFNEMLAKMLAEKVGPARAARVDSFVAVRALVLMLIGLFVEQEIFQGKRVRPVDAKVLTTSIAELFLQGVNGTAAPKPERKRTGVPRKGALLPNAKRKRTP